MFRKLKSLDKIFLGIFTTILVIVFFVCAVIRTELIDMVLKRAVAQLNMASELTTSTLAKEIQSGNHRYAWKQLIRGIEKDGLKIFNIVNSNHEAVVDDIDFQNLIEKLEKNHSWYVYEAGENEIRIDKEYRLVKISNKVQSSIESQAEYTIEYYYDIKFISDAVSSITYSIFFVTIFLLFLLLLGFIFLKKSFEKSLFLISQGVETILTNSLMKDKTKVLVDEYFSTKYFLEDFRKRYEKSRTEALQSKTYAAIAQTSQMLAHDVRKPFELISMMLNKLKATTPTQLTKIVERYTPEIERTISNVDAMVDDVMEINRNTKPIRNLISIKRIIAESLSTVCRSLVESDVKISYKFNHTMMLHVADQKIQRAFINIIGNAIQAMDGKGRLDISTREELDKKVTTINIRNYGSYIEKQNLNRIFEAFYTANKTRGTGLGLLIAKKIVTVHGGDIWCDSSKEDNYVDFGFTLPISIDNKDSFQIELPGNSKQLELNSGFVSIKEEETTNKQYKVILIEDDSFFAGELIEGMSDANIIHFTSPGDFLAEIKSDPILIDTISGIILDNYFENDSFYTGLLLGKKLKEDFSFDQPIILFSSGYYEKQEIEEGGIDLSLPKAPILWSQIISKIPHRVKSHNDLVEEIKYRKPHELFSRRQKSIFSRIRHDIRAKLAKLETLTNKLKAGTEGDLTLDLFKERNLFIREYLTFFDEESINMANNSLIFNQEGELDKNQLSFDDIDKISKELRTFRDSWVFSDRYWFPEIDTHTPKSNDFGKQFAEKIEQGMHLEEVTSRNKEEPAKMNFKVLLTLKDKKYEKKLFKDLSYRENISVTDDANELRNCSVVHTDNQDIIDEALDLGIYVLSVSKLISDNEDIQKVVNKIVTRQKVLAMTPS